MGGTAPHSAFLRDSPTGEEIEAIELLKTYRPDYFLSGHIHNLPYQPGNSWRNKHRGDGGYHSRPTAWRAHPKPRDNRVTEWRGTMGYFARIKSTKWFHSSRKNRRCTRSINSLPISMASRTKPSYAATGSDGTSFIGTAQITQ